MPEVVAKHLLAAAVLERAVRPRTGQPIRGRRVAEECFVPRLKHFCQRDLRQRFLHHARAAVDDVGGRCGSGIGQHDRVDLGTRVKRRLNFDHRRGAKIVGGGDDAVRR